MTKRRSIPYPAEHCERVVRLFRKKHADYTSDTTSSRRIGVVHLGQGAGDGRVLGK